MKYSKKCALSTFLFLTIFSLSLRAQNEANWSILIYTQTDNILNNFAIRNFNSMAAVGSNDKLNIIVQWNQPNKKGIWRYKIDKNKMTLIGSRERKINNNYAQDLIDFVQFSVDNYPAKNYALILWNHGVGIIDPAWEKLQQFIINPNAMSVSTRTQIKEITKSFNSKKGILFDMTSKTYMNNQDLSTALESISTNILHKKIDLLGMDACLMAMLEIGYQIKNYAKYFISSEEVELAQGWNYAPFLYILARSNINKKQLAQNIVFTYEDFFKNKTQFYTQSAIKLKGINYIKQNLDQIVSNISLCKNIDKERTTLLINKARKLCMQFSTSCYVDLYSFYNELHKQLISLELLATRKQQTYSNRQKHNPRIQTIKLDIESQKLVSSQNFKNLKENLMNGMKLIEHFVVANVTSHYLSEAKGISIYFPQRIIDISYLKTKFAQESLWLNFLHDVLEK